MTNTSGSSPNKAFLSTAYQVRNPAEVRGPFREEVFGNIVYRTLGLHIDIYDFSSGETYVETIFVPTPNYTPGSLNLLTHLLFANGERSTFNWPTAVVTVSSEPDPYPTSNFIDIPIGGFGGDSIPTWYFDRGESGLTTVGDIPDPPTGGNISPTDKPTTVFRAQTNVGSSVIPFGQVLNTALLYAPSAYTSARVAASGPMNYTVPFADGARMVGRPIIYAEAV